VAGSAERRPVGTSKPEGSDEVAKESKKLLTLSAVLLCSLLLLNWSATSVVGETWTIAPLPEAPGGFAGNAVRADAIPAVSYSARLRGISGNNDTALLLTLGIALLGLAAVVRRAP